MHNPFEEADAEEVCTSVHVIPTGSARCLIGAPSHSPCGALEDQSTVQTASMEPITQSLWCSLRLEDCHRVTP